MEVRPGKPDRGGLAIGRTGGDQGARQGRAAKRNAAVGELRRPGQAFSLSLFQRESLAGFPPSCRREGAWASRCCGRAVGDSSLRVAGVRQQHRLTNRGCILSRRYPRQPNERPSPGSPPRTSIVVKRTRAVPPRTSIVVKRYPGAALPPHRPLAIVLFCCAARGMQKAAMVSRRSEAPRRVPSPAMKTKWAHDDMATLGRVTV